MFTVIVTVTFSGDEKVSGTEFIQRNDKNLRLIKGVSIW